MASFRDRLKRFGKALLDFDKPQSKAPLDVLENLTPRSERAKRAYDDSRKLLKQAQEAREETRPSSVVRNAGETLPDATDTAYYKTPGTKQLDRVRVGLPFTDKSIPVGKGVNFLARETTKIPGRIAGGAAGFTANQVDRGFGKDVDATKDVADLATFGEGAVDLLTLGNAKKATSAVKGADTLGKAFVQGGTRAAKVGTPIAAFHAMSQTRGDDVTVGDQFKTGAKTAAIAAPASFLLGGTAAAGSKVVGRGWRALSNHFSKQADEVAPATKALGSKVVNQGVPGEQVSKKNTVFRAVDSTNQGQALGPGTYFADTPDAAKAYGQNVLPFELKKGTRLIDLSSQSTFDDFMKKALKSMGTKRYRNLLNKEGLEAANSQAMKEYAQKIGYDGIRTNIPSIGSVVFDSSNLKPSPQAGFVRLGAGRTGREASEEVAGGTGGRLNRGDISGSLPKGKKERGFAQTVRQDVGTPDQIVRNLTDNPDLYDPLSNEKVVNSVVKKTKGKIPNLIQFARRNTGTTEGNAAALMAMDRQIKSNNIDAAEALLREFSPRFTEQGQTVQILGMYSKMTPTGALRYMQRLVDKVNTNLPSGQKIKLDDATRETVLNMAKELQTMPAGRGKVIRTQQMLKEMQQIVPPNLADKLQTSQILAQLVNFKTPLRNIFGNTGLGMAENVKDVAATGVDRTVTKIRNALHKIAPEIFDEGVPTKSIPSLGNQLRAGRKGLQEAVEEIQAGIDLRPGVRTQFDIPQREAFRSATGKKLLRVLNYELRAPDRAAFQAAYSEVIRQGMVAQGLDKPTPALQRIATEEALYRTFQNDSVAARMLSGFKNKVLNRIGIKGTNGNRFGLGNVVLNYPKTPGNILNVGLDYSGVGFVKAVGEMAKPLLGKTFNQNAFVENISRALTGTASLVGTGALLHRLGIITGEGSDDLDIISEERARGFGEFRFNVSALKRLVASGFSDVSGEQEDDLTISYDWFQPLAISLAVGADIDRSFKEQKAQGEVAQSVVEQIIQGAATGSQTAQKQPVLTSVTTFLTNKDIVDAMVRAGADLPASMVPTLLSHIRHLVDNNARETRDAGVLSQGFNRAVNRVPGLSYALPQRYEVTGDPQQYYEELGPEPLHQPIRFFNIFFNPSFVNRIKQTPEGEEILRIMDVTGQTKQARRLVPKKLKVTKEGEAVDVELDAEQVSKFQEFVGTRTTLAYQRLISSPEYIAMTDEERAEKMADIQSAVFQAAKISMFGHEVKRVYPLAKALVLSGTFDNGEVNYGVTKLPTEEGGNRFQTVSKEYETYKDVRAILESGLPEDQTIKALNTLGVSEADATYYDIARKNTDLRKAYTKDHIETFEGPREELLQELVAMRKELAGKAILTSSVINDLVEEGWLTKAEGKFLKDISFGPNGARMTGGGSGGAGRKVRISSPGAVSSFRVNFGKQKDRRRGVRLAPPAVSLPKTNLRLDIGGGETIGDYRRAFLK